MGISPLPLIELYMTVSNHTDLPAQVATAENHNANAKTNTIVLSSVDEPPKGMVLE